MIRNEEVYKIGVITKPHGISGEVVLSFTDDVFDRVDADYLVCMMDGILVPFFLEEYRFKTDTTALVKFEDIDNSEQARQLQGVEVYFPISLAAQATSSGLSWGSFVGMKVLDINRGELGEVIEVNTQTINTLFIIEGENGELMIPAQEEFIVGMDMKKCIITMDLPEGLIDLHED